MPAISNRRRPSISKRAGALVNTHLSTLGAFTGNGHDRIALRRATRDDAEIARSLSRWIHGSLDFPFRTQRPVNPVRRAFVPSQAQANRKPPFLLEVTFPQPRITTNDPGSRSGVGFRAAVAYTIPRHRRR